MKYKLRENLNSFGIIKTSGREIKIAEVIFERRIRINVLRFCVFIHNSHFFETEDTHYQIERAKTSTSRTCEIIQKAGVLRNWGGIGVFPNDYY